LTLQDAPPSLLILSLVVCAPKDLLACYGPVRAVSAVCFVVCGAISVAGYQPIVSIYFFEFLSKLQSNI
jgi:hypothetical protein